MNQKKTIQLMKWLKVLFQVATIGTLIWGFQLKKAFDCPIDTQVSQIDMSKYTPNDPAWRIATAVNQHAGVLEWVMKAAVDSRTHAIIDDYTKFRIPLVFASFSILCEIGILLCEWERLKRFFTASI